MKTLLVNLKAYLLGLGKLRTLEYKAGWNAWKFLPLYLTDYLSHVLTGGAVVSWSRWCFDHRKTNRLAAFIDRLLGHADRNHGMLAGPALFGTVDCHWLTRCLVCLAWAALLWSLL